MSWPLESDMAHARMMERGSETLLTAIEQAMIGRDPKTQPRLIWSSSDGWPRDPDSKQSQYARQAEERILRKEREAEAARTLRDPCPRCGVRMDIGCSHVKHMFTAHDLLTDVNHVNRAWDRAIREGREG